MGSILLKSLEELENDKWPRPKSFPTEMIRQVYLLRQKPIIELNANDLRLLISQNVGLEYLIPLSMKFFEKEIFYEALYYPGDLLLAVLNVDPVYWESNKNEAQTVLSIIEKGRFAENDDIDEDVLLRIDTFISQFLKQ